MTKQGSLFGRESFQDKLADLNPNQLLVISFVKEHCDKCDQVGDFYDSLDKKYEDVTFLNANVMQNPDAVKELNLKSVPTFCAFKNHRELGRYEGTNPKAIEGLVESFRNALPQDEEIQPAAEESHGWFFG